MTLNIEQMFIESKTKGSNINIGNIESRVIVAERWLQDLFQGPFYYKFHLMQGVDTSIGYILKV